MRNDNGDSVSSRARSARAKKEDAVDLAELQGGSSIEKIRDLIFGAEMEAYEEEFTRIEEAIHKSNADLQEELRTRFASLEAFVVKEVAAIVEKLDEERKERTADNKALIKDLAKATRNSEKQFDKLKSTGDKTSEVLASQIRERAQSIQETFDRRTDELRLAVDAALEELRGTKVDRQALADTLSSLAARIANDGAEK